ncbi:MAG: DUF2226 domain-containing protein [Candidatus Diapherotrites archaeon]|nr:DUF2226 domain-containing protein [Candidatus Diapherotrites archaeon]
MSIPVGTQKIKGEKVSANKLLEDVHAFMEQNSTGYFCITIKGKYGMEEGLLIIENGRAIGANYEYLNFDKAFNANDGLTRVLNAFHAKYGIYDCFELSVQQIELLKIFNENMLFLEPMDYQVLEGMIPVSFSYEFEEALVSKKATTREDVLKARRLSEIEMNDYQRLSEEMAKGARKPTAPEKVEKDVSTYLTGMPETSEPKEAPKIEEKEVSKKIVIPEPQSPKAEELKGLDDKAEALLKTLKKVDK